MRLIEKSIASLMLAIATIMVSGCTPVQKTRVPRADRSLTLGEPLWSSSGAYLLADQGGIDSPQQFLCINCAPKKADVMETGGESSVIESWAWASNRNELCYIWNSTQGRVLRISNTSGRTLQEVGLSQDFSSCGLEWTRDGRIIIVDEKPSGPDPHGLQPSVVRVFTEKLRKKQDFVLPFTLYNIQLHPKLANRIVAVAGGKYDCNVISINLATKAIEQITDFGGVNYGSGHWKFVEPGRVYFTSLKSGKYDFGELYVYDARTHKVQVVSDTILSAVGNFDVLGSKVAIASSSGQLLLVDLTNHHITALAKDKAYYYFPRFSADGQRLAVVRNYRELVVKDLRNGGDKLLYVAK